MTCQVLNCERKARRFVVIPYFRRAGTSVVEVVVCDKHLDTEIKGKK